MAGTGLPAPQRIRVGSVAGFLAAVPHLLGFRPADSLVVVGVAGPRHRVRFTFRYDLPDPPDAARAAQIAEHAITVLRRQRVRTVVIVGYGPGRLVTPVADVAGAVLRRERIAVSDLLRVEDGRYWSYLCRDPGCCPPEGVPFDALAEPVAARLASAGLAVYPDRESMVGALAPVTGAQAESMQRATDRALRRAAALTAEAVGAPRRGGAFRLMVDAGRAAVRDAIRTYRDGGRVCDADQLAWLTVALTDVRVRDDAWARMLPEFRSDHRRLWTDVVRHACPGYAAAPASLLAFTAWQMGNGALANIAIERALTADPGYSMANLLSRAIDAGLPPSAARLPMTPDEVEASYARSERSPRSARSARAASKRPSE